MNGVVAFFDILGYKSLIKNTKATDAAEEVLNLLISIPRLVRRYLEGCTFTNKSDEIKYIIFSDTIIVSSEYTHEDNDEIKFAFTVFCELLFVELLLAGFPVRGAIVEGDYLFKESCLAGQAVIDAYELSESLDFAGVVLNKPLFEGESSEIIFLKYLAPFKNEEKYVQVLNWMDILRSVYDKDYERAKQDLEMFISKSFWEHNKDCPQSVNSKLNNTIKLARRLIIETERIRNKKSNPLDALPAPDETIANK